MYNITIKHHATDPPFQLIQPLNISRPTRIRIAVPQLVVTSIVNPQHLTIPEQNQLQ